MKKAGTRPDPRTRKSFTGFLAAIMLVCMSLPAAAQDSREIAEVRSSYRQAERVFFSRDDIAAARAILDAHLDARERIRDPQWRRLMNAQASVHAGYFEMNGGRDSIARELLEQGISHSEAVIAQGGSGELISEAYRIAADAYLFLANIRGPLFQMSNGAKFRDYPIKALEYHPENRRARLSRAVFLASVPPLVGGNPAEAARLLEDSLEGSEAELQFQMLVWLGIANQRLGDDRQALSAWERAERIIPGSSWIAELRAKI